MIKLKLHRIVHNISIYKKLVFYCCCYGENENQYLLLFHCRYFRSCWVVLYQTYNFCPNLSSWLVVMATKRLNSWHIFKEAILGIKLELCRNVHSITLYKTVVYYCCCICTLVAMATSSCLLSSPPPNIKLLCKILVLICCCYCNWKAKVLN